MIALTSLLHANSNKTNIIQSDYQCFCSSVNAAENHNPIDFFLRCSNPGLGSPLVNKSPSCSAVDIFSNFIVHFKIFLLKPNSLCMVMLASRRKLRWKIFGQIKSLASSLWIKTWMVVLPTVKKVYWDVFCLDHSKMEVVLLNCWISLMTGDFKKLWKYM